MKTDFQAKTIARLVAGAEHSCPVRAIPGDSPPHVEGEGAHYTNKSGDLIRYPNAYNWFKIYHPSTREVVYGEDWMDLRLWREDWTHGIRSAIRCKQRVWCHGWRADPGYIVRNDNPIWLVVGPSGIRYHAFRDRWKDPAQDAHRAIRTAIEGLKKQRNATRAWVSTLGRDLSSIWVSVEDGVRAGNCRLGCDDARDRIQAQEGPIEAIRADLLLAWQDSPATRRSIAAAASK